MKKMMEERKYSQGENDPYILTMYDTVTCIYYIAEIHVNLRTTNFFVNNIYSDAYQLQS